MTNSIKKVLTGCILVLTLALVSTAAMAATVPGKISGTNVKMRKAPNTSATIIQKLTNSTVTVVDKSGDWYKVSFNKKTGWVNDDYIKLVSVKGNINSNGVNFRISPSTSSKKISVLKKNTAVVVLQTSKGWNKIKIGTKTGYVASKFVSNSAAKTTSNLNTATKETVSKDVFQTTAAKVSRSTDAVTLSDALEEAETINDRIVSYAKQFNGVKYLYGGDTPQSGFDCSGFVGYVYIKFGVKLNRSAAGMYSNGLKVSKKELEPGDILFFDASSRKASGTIDHVGLYLGGDSFIHASSSNGKVRIQKLSEYRGIYLGAKRVI